MSWSHHLQEQIEGWVADFCDSTRYSRLPSAVKEYATPVLVTLLVSACERGQGEPGDVSQADLRAALLESVARLELPESVRPEVPELCRSFLEELEVQGRLSGGAQLGAYVGALHIAHRAAAAERTRPIENVASKLSRNDPCPCGSGKKYKKCCMGLLDRD